MAVLTEALVLFLVVCSWNRAAAFTVSGICPLFFLKSIHQPLHCSEDPNDTTPQ